MCACFNGRDICVLVLGGRIQEHGDRCLENVREKEKSFAI